MIGFIGIKNTVADVWLGVINWLFVPVNKKQVVQEKEPTRNLDWKAILYHGDTEIPLSDSALNHLILTTTTPNFEENEVVTS